MLRPEQINTFLCYLFLKKTCHSKVKSFHRLVLFHLLTSKKNNFFQVYLNNKTQIDPVLDKVKAQLNEISGKVAAMIPQAKPAEKTE